MNARWINGLVSGALLTALAWGAGCTSVLKPKVDSTRFFVLGAPKAPEAAEVRMFTGSVGLLAIRLPGYLADRREFATRTGAEVRYLSHWRWAEGRERAVADRLRLALADRLRGAQVQRVPWADRFRPEVVIGLDLERFEADDQGVVHFVVRWSLLDGETRALRTTGRFSASLAGPADDPDSRVERLGQLVDQLASELANRVATP